MKDITNKFRGLIERANMSLPEFAEYFQIPYRTVYSWASNERPCAGYLLKLMEYKLLNEHIIE